MDPVDRKRRRTLRLGKVSQRIAEATKVRVEHLVSARAMGHTIDAETAHWVAGIADDLAKKLAILGLIPPRETVGQIGLKGFLEGVRDSKPNLKPNTLRNYDQTIKRLVSHFGEDCRLDAINGGQADSWRDAMLTSGLSPATVGREVKRARQFFRVAVSASLSRTTPLPMWLPRPRSILPAPSMWIVRQSQRCLLPAPILSGG